MAKQAITLGIPIALSGRYSLQGRQCLEGLRGYVRDANAGGGIFVRAVGRRLPLELRFYDDESDEHATARWTERLIGDDRVDLLLGPYGSGPARAAAAVADAHGQILWNHSGAAETSAGGRGSRVVSILSPASRYLCAILDLVKAIDPNFRRAALYHSTTGFAGEVIDGARGWMQQAGVTLVVDQSYRSGEDVGRFLNCLANNSVDVVLGVGRIEDDLQLARRLLEARPAVRAVGLVAAAISRFRDELGRCADGFLGPSQWEPQVRYGVCYGPSASEFLKRYLATAAVPIDYPAAQGYAAGLIAQRCVETAGTLDAEAVHKAAARLRLTTFYGPYAIDGATGRQTAHPVLVTQWQAGRKAVVWPSDVAETEPWYPAPPWA